MRAFAWFLVTLLAAAYAGAAIAYPLYELTSQVASWPFHRVMSRAVMLLAALGLVLLCRRARLTTKRDLGYGLPWRRFVAVALGAGAVGIASAAAGAAFLVAAHLRVWSDPRAFAAAGGIAHLVLLGLSSGLGVALLEETVMRGALHTAIARESGQIAAIALTAPLFAVLHFFGRARIPAGELGWSSGFHLLALSFAPLAHPAGVLDAFLAWLAVSIVLSLTRALSGNIAAAIGLHAGWVMVLRILSESSAPGGAAADSVWVSQVDRLLGLWMLPWAAALAAAIWLTRARWIPYAGGAPSAAGATVSGASLSRR
jgi:membrane protease YdiL (CAAX protease family)